MREICGACRTCSMDQASRGLPPTGRMFLSGTTVEPPRVATTAIICINGVLELAWGKQGKSDFPKSVPGGQERVKSDGLG